MTTLEKMDVVDRRNLMNFKASKWICVLQHIMQDGLAYKA
jgi:hypothetical protein